MSFVQIHLVFSAHVVFQILKVSVSQKKTGQEMEVITIAALEGIYLVFLSFFLSSHCFFSQSISIYLKLKALK